MLDFPCLIRARHFLQSYPEVHVRVGYSLGLLLRAYLFSVSPDGRQPGQCLCNDVVSGIHKTG